MKGLKMSKHYSMNIGGNSRNRAYSTIERNEKNFGSPENITKQNKED